MLNKINHANLLNVGTYTHAQIDEFIESHTHKSKALLLFGYGDLEFSNIAIIIEIELDTQVPT